MPAPVAHDDVRQAAEAIAALCDASDLVVTRCLYCKGEVTDFREHWRDNPPPHPGGYWDCPRRRT